MFKAFRNCCAVFLLAFAALAAADQTAAEQTAVHTYQVPGHGSVQLSVPKSWHEEIQQPRDNQPLTITFKPASGPAFQIMVSPLTPPRPDTPRPTPQMLRSNMERIIGEIAPQAVEKNIALKEIRGASTTGYYFSATDKAPAPGEFRLMTQAGLGLDELVILMTVLTDDESGAVLSQALDMIKTAKHVK